MSDVLAVLCSDLHLSERCPTARAEKDNWLDVQASYLNQLGDLSKKHRAPIVCAGDIFDRWNPPISFVNWVVAHIPKMYAIPGQHDLPYHRMERIGDTAFWNLVENGRIDCIREGGMERGGLMLWGFPWGVGLHSLKDTEDGNSDLFNLAVCHRYIWAGNKKYPGAPQDAHAGKLIDYLDGYDASVFGDNHKGFIFGNVLNCGTFLRRKRDEIEYVPQVGLLRRKGIEIVELDTSKDLWMEETIVSEHEYDMSALMQELSNEAYDSLDFEEAARKELSKISKPAQELLLKALEGSK